MKYVGTIVLVALLGAMLTGCERRSAEDEIIWQEDSADPDTPIVLMEVDRDDSLTANQRGVTLGPDIGSGSEAGGVDIGGPGSPAPTPTPVPLNGRGAPAR